MISVEDRRFRYHLGVDPIGIGRAIYSQRDAGGGRVRATSTITQQLARNVFLSNSRSYTRKIREGVLALALERKFSKDQILELYLNKVYFGGGAYGVDSASRKFFNHDATDAVAGRSRDHRRAGQGTVALFAHRRYRGCDRPRGRRAAA